MRNDGQELVSPQRSTCAAEGTLLRRAIDRLKVLKDEIRKPYFLELKRFLNNKGVRGPENSRPNLDIYPSRA